MPEMFGVIVEGAREVDIRFDQFPQDCHDRLRQRIENRVGILAAQIRSRVPRRTGKLASEVKSGIRDTKERITGSVTFSADFAKAGALEYGAHRAAKVRAHTETRRQVFGHTLSSPITVSIAAHSRQLNIPAHNFLRGSLEADKSAIEQDLREAVEGAVAQSER